VVWVQRRPRTCLSGGLDDSTLAHSGLSYLGSPGCVQRQLVFRGGTGEVVRGSTGFAGWPATGTGVRRARACCAAIFPPKGLPGCGAWARKTAPGACWAPLKARMGGTSCRRPRFAQVQSWGQGCFFPRANKLDGRDRLNRGWLARCCEWAKPRGRFHACRRRPTKLRCTQPKTEAHHELADFQKFLRRRGCRLGRAGLDRRPRRPARVDSFTEADRGHAVGCPCLFFHGRVTVQVLVGRHRC